MTLKEKLEENNEAQEGVSMAKSSVDADQQRCPTSPPSKSLSSANLSRLVKEMVKEMDDNEFYSRNELYDDLAEVGVLQKHGIKIATL